MVKILELSFTKHFTGGLMDGLSIDCAITFPETSQAHYLASFAEGKSYKGGCGGSYTVTIKGITDTGRTI